MSLQIGPVFLYASMCCTLDKLCTLCMFFIECLSSQLVITRVLFQVMKMYSKVFIFLTGAVYIYYQVENPLQSNGVLFCIGVQFTNQGSS